MTATPEGKVKKRVKKMLEHFKPQLYCNWPVPAGYGESTLDCFGWLNGHAFAIETKRPGEDLTPRQELIAANMRAAGGAVFVIGKEAILGTNGKVRYYSGELELLKWLELHK